jgi:hypothetical protein
MTRRPGQDLPPAAERLLLALAASEPHARMGQTDIDADALACLLRADLVAAVPGGQSAVITAAGHAHLVRCRIARGATRVDPFLGQHLDLVCRATDTPNGRAAVMVNDAESPLAWLARRKGRDGRPLIAVEQVQAGEKLRAQFTRANLTPRMTSNWDAPIARGARSRAGGGAASLAGVIIAARLQVRRALDAAGPEFAGLLVDVCCFLKGLEDVERERGWPPRSAKVVLQLGLDRLARHYGLAAEARGHARAPLRTWFAADAAFDADGS